MPIVTIRMKDEEYQSLADAAASRGIGISTFAKLVINSHLKDGDQDSVHQLLDTFEQNPQLVSRLRRIVLFTSG